MKTLVLTSAIAVALTAPAFASNEYATIAGVDASDFTQSELVRLNTAIENDDYAYVNFLLNGGSNVSGPTDAAIAFSIEQAEQDNEFATADFLQNGGSEIVSTQSFGATDAGREFAIEQARQDDNWSLVRYLENGGSLN